jgi:hypothetical protein
VLHAVTPTLEEVSVADVVAVVNFKDNAEVLHKTNRIVNQTVRILSETLGHNPLVRLRRVLVFCALC